MIRIDRARSDCDRRAGHTADVEQIEADRCSGHIHDRVDGTDLMKMNIVEAHSMDLGLGTAKSLENRECPLLDGG